MSEMEECGAAGPPNGWLCREPKGHPGDHVYRPTAPTEDAQEGSEVVSGMMLYGATLGTASEMVQKVAAKLREIAPNMPFAVAGGDAHELLARAAIEAMREPDHEMITAGVYSDRFQGVLGDDEARAAVKHIFSDMVGNALGEVGGR